MKKLALFFAIFSFIFLVSVFYSPVFAQAPASSGAGGGITNPAIGSLGGNTVGGVGGVEEAKSGVTFLRYFITLWGAFISVGAIAVIIVFLWGAIEWITAGGDAGKVGKARDKIIQAVIGMILLVGSFVIIAFISQLFFGEVFDILNPVLPVVN